MDEYDVLVVGGTGVDTIVRVDTLPLPFQDSIGVPPIQDYVAHTGNGVALGMLTLGLRTKFIDFLGDDPQGEQILAAYARRGLDFSHLPAPAGTPRAVNLVDAEGRRLSLYDGRHPADLLMPRDFYLPFLQRARHVHLSIINHTRALWDDIERLGVSTSTDLHDWDGRNPYHLQWALRADVVFLSASALRGGADGDRHEEAMRAILTEGRARVVVATAGAEGCFVLTREELEERDGAVRHFPAVPPAPDRPVVDSNGAGDAFVCGFLTSFLAGRPVPECVLAGSVSGAFACGSAGTHTEFIDPDQLAEGCRRAADTLASPAN
ncbi:carbohydrate kinase family protein [Allostreptomyces psammosilenae]|uniref:Sugar/nucleoside kinase (Ribokinase family) n=1 Tax=Allostreptomyces psammosilenae TaxID=1892865 RepID=A0A853A031_9ACTN|nr:PfkB family carbohydrate kinase [Allostreptomyces psammosilenae]NYI04181.1 sugar/nucleoside kinase (ribokinase family) [Allostreptomyces psammosilenae]